MDNYRPVLDPNVAFDKIAGFQSANELAEYLRAENCQGHMQIETSCPIAIYFYRHVQQMTVVNEFVTIGNNYSMIDDSIVDGWMKECSEVMKEFISGFDTGNYPDLIQCTEDEYCCCPDC